MHSFSANVFDRSGKVYLRVIIDRKVFTKSLKILWKQRNRADKKAMIKSVLDKCEDINTKAVVFNRDLTMEAFKEKFLDNTDHSNFLQFFENTIKQRVKDKEIDYYKTRKYHVNTLNSLKAFKKKVSFSDYTIDFIYAFDKWLKNVGLNKPNSYNTRVRHHKHIKCYLNIAVQRGIIQENPYKDYVLSERKTVVKRLTDKELSRLVSLYRENRLVEYLQITLQRFLFACFTGGIRISDMLRLKWDNISDNTVSFVMHKGRNQNPRGVDIPMSELSKELIYNKSGRGLLFPYRNEQNINKDLKVLAEMAQINKPLTFHYSRHTFCSRACEIANVMVVKTLSGHAKASTLERYVTPSDKHKEDVINSLAG